MCYHKVIPLEVKRVEITRSVQETESVPASRDAALAAVKAAAMQTADMKKTA